MISGESVEVYWEEVGLVTNISVNGEPQRGDVLIVAGQLVVVLRRVWKEDGSLHLVVGTDE